MSKPDTPLTLAQTKVGLNGGETLLRQQFRERLARIFRHVGPGADDRYLLELVTRYRELDPS